MTRETSPSLPARRRLAVLPALAACSLLVVLAGCSTTLSSAHPAVGAPVDDLTVRPHVGDWRFDNPYIPQLQDDSRSAVLRGVLAVGPGKALALSTLESDDDTVAPQATLTLLDTGSGRQFWSRTWHGTSIRLAAGYGEKTIVLSDDDSTLTSLRVADGTTTGTARGSIPGGVSFPGEPGAPQPKPGTLLVANDDGVNLYSADHLRAPLWTRAIAADGGLHGWSADLLFTADAAYSLDTGKKVAWPGAVGRDIYYLPVTALWPAVGQGRILRVESDETTGSGTMDLVSAKDGASDWSVRFSGDQKGGVGFDRDGLLVTQHGTLTKYDGATGKKLWSKPGYGAASSLATLQPTETGTTDRILAASPTDSHTTVVLDPASGKKLYTVTQDKPIGSDGSAGPVVGASDHVLYVVKAGSSGTVLYGLDITSGLEKWRIPQPFSNWYTFRMLGGHLVASIDDLSVTKGDRDEFGDHPAVLGIGAHGKG
jgi:hypothetical protein